MHSQPYYFIRHQTYIYHFRFPFPVAYFRFRFVTTSGHEIFLLPVALHFHFRLQLCHFRLVALPFPVWAAFALRQTNKISFIKFTCWEKFILSSCLPDNLLSKFSCGLHNIGSSAEISWYRRIDKSLVNCILEPTGANQWHEHWNEPAVSLITNKLSNFYSLHILTFQFNFVWV